MPTFTLNNGISYNCRFCGLASAGILYVDLIGLNLREAMDIFEDTQNTQNLKYVGGEETQEYVGYTKLLGVEWVYNSENTVRISLRRPYVGEEV